MSGPVLEGIVKINEWLKAFQRLVYRESEPEQEFEQTANQDPEQVEITSDEENTGQNPIQRRIRQSASDINADEENTGVEGSYHLELLVKKLKAFDCLISEQKYINATIVADDINAIIASFDPRIYFPKLFVNFVLKSATSITNLTSCEEYKESPIWHAMQDLYRVDLDSFVNFNPDTSAFSNYEERAYDRHDEYQNIPEPENEKW
jgi:hypothetical protein